MRKFNFDRLAVCVGFVLAGMVGGFHSEAQGQAGPAQAAPAPGAPADTAEPRAQYEQWRVLLQQIYEQERTTP